MTRLASFLVIGLSLLPTAAAAQEPPEVRPGAAVRVWTSSTSAPFVGKVLAQDGTSMFLAAEGFDAPVTVTRNSITRIDISRGRRSGGKTVLHGILIGAAVGFAWGMIEGDDPQNQFLAYTAFEKGLLLNILTVPAGALVGALVGPGPEHWTTTTPTSAKLSQTVAVPSPSLRFSFRF